MQQRRRKMMQLPIFLLVFLRTNNRVNLKPYSVSPVNPPLPKGNYLFFNGLLNEKRLRQILCWSCLAFYLRPVFCFLGFA